MRKKNIQQLANTIARRNGRGFATEIVVRDDISEPYVDSVVLSGYRKRTTGEYVPLAYRSKFGWKNTYYQSAETVVVLPLAMVKLCSDYAGN